VVIDIVGKANYRRSLRCIKPGGYFIHGNASTLTMIRRLWSRLTSNKKVRIALAGYQPEDMETLRQLVGSGTVKALIDRTYDLDQVVKAHRYVESGQRVGNVVLTVQS
jgi:NADPH:quinone reductase-like Zn-dependent oxidoreductase